VLPALRFVDNHDRPAETYPFNPNGSAGVLPGVTTADGRFTLLMPHPDRTARVVQMSWHSAGLGKRSDEASPWLRMFRNARVWLG
jgi:phosphoribosylformylglycinamidine synthase